MANFEPAFDFMFAHEGGYINLPEDKGGATKYGVSLRFLKRVRYTSLGGDLVVTPEGIKKLTIDDALCIYHKHFWKPQPYKRLNNQELANKVFDMSVNMGPRRANKLFQSALNGVLVSVYGALNPTDVHGVLVIDGILGARTLEISDLLNPEKVLTHIKSRCQFYYLNLVRRDKSQGVFLKGWLNRAKA